MIDPEEGRTLSLEMYIKAELRRMNSCPRCTGTWWTFDDGRCVICGLTWDQQGPPSSGRFVGILGEPT